MVQFYFTVISEGELAAVDMPTNFTNGSSLQENFRCDFSADDSLAAQISKIIVYAIILFSSLVGNVLIIIIVHKRPELRKTINFFIVNMAVSDFVFPLTAIPFSIHQIASRTQRWPFGGTAGLILCKLRGFLQAVSITVSAQSHVWIAVDRFVAVFFPMKINLISTRSRLITIASTWIVSIMTKGFYFYSFGLVQENDEIICSGFFNASNSFIHLTYSKVYTALFQIAPLIVMTVLYSAIAVSLRRQDKALRSAPVEQLHQRKRRAIKMSFYVMAAFYICFLPRLSYFILWQYDIALSCSFSKELLFIASLMLYLSSTMNPIICMTFVESYRRGLRKILSSCCSQRLPVYDLRTDRNAQEITLQEIRVIRET